MRKDKRSLDDPLGIADAPVPQDADDIHATNDPDEVAHRRARALGEADVKCGPALATSTRMDSAPRRSTWAMAARATR